MVIFLGNARCYHTFDWIRCVERNLPDIEVVIITDLIESEGYERIVKPSDKIINLFNVDKLLLKKQSRFGNIWRNFIKFALLPLQALFLRKRLKPYSGVKIHAHTMYYMLLARLAGVKVIGTPQGSEILVRPDRSRVYRFFCIQALRFAEAVTVDSLKMKNRIRDLAGVEAHIIQNGINLELIKKHKKQQQRSGILSFRGITPLYQTDRFVDAYLKLKPSPPITFIYPFCDENFKDQHLGRLSQHDNINDLGRVNTVKMIELFSETLLAVSIPNSDSSPRSVYEAIFCGAIIVATELEWIEALPSCMQQRIIKVDVNLDSSDWLPKALEYAEQCHQSGTYTPSQDALEMFDENVSITNFAKAFYFETTN